MPELIGGSADLAGSNLTLWSGSRPLRRGEGGNYIFYGVREFGMSAVMNGLALHGGLIPYGGTFLTFSDYARNALRMAALMKVRQHLRLHPRFHRSGRRRPDPPVDRACRDTAPDSGHGSLAAVRHHRDGARLDCRHRATRRSDLAACFRARTCLSSRARTSRSQLIASRRVCPLRGVRRCAQSRSDCHRLGSRAGAGVPEERWQAKASLRAWCRCRAPRCSTAQEQSYRDAVLPRGVRRVAIEAGVTDYWRKYVGLEGGVVGIDRFGESAPAGELFKYFGFTVANVVDTVKRVLHG